MSGEEKKSKGFVFVDKRKTHEGEEKADRKVLESSIGREDEKKAPETERTRRESPGALPEIDFNSFILSLSSSAMMHLGVIPSPISKKTEKNLPLAKQTVDIISLLEKKTRGNLAPEEKQFIEAVLYDLRMKYVEVSKGEG